MTPDQPGVSPDVPQTQREHAFDQLRALAMLAGVLFHASLAYSPSLSPYWPTADRHNWTGMDVLIWLPHLVRMPLFFLVAGYFAALLLGRRGMIGLARQRIRRILVPFLLAWPLVHFSMNFSVDWALATVTHPSNFLLMVREWLALPERPLLPPRTGHLWFLYYLLIFSLLLWIARSLELNRLLDKWVAAGLPVIVLSLPLMVLPGFALTSAPHPAPEGLLPQFWAIGIFGPFFALGVVLHGRLELLCPLQRWLLPGLLVCLILYALFLLSLHQQTPGASRVPILTAGLEAMIAAWGTLLCLLAGLRWLSHPRTWMRYLSASAYWTYLLHLPVLFMIQFPLMDRAWPWPLKLSVSVTLTMLICLLSYEVVVRRTRLRRWVG